MARPITNRDPEAQIGLLNPPDGQQYDRLEYMVQPDGMFATAQPHDAGPNVAIIAKNFLINENGKFQVRRPLNRVFYDAAVTPIGLIGVTDATGTGLLLLFTKAGIKWSADGGTSWTDSTGPALSAGPAIALINYVMWDTAVLLFTTDAGNKIYTYNTTTKVYSEIATTQTAHVITVFANRAIVAAANATTLYWSVKNDNTDFAGIGSGFEPLRLSPGTSADNIIGLFPVDDTHMLIVRTGSVWLATTTGNVDVPFQFDFLYRVNLASARSLAYSSSGIYAWGLDNAYLLTIQGPEPIGDPILGGWVNSDYVVYNQYLSVGCYEALKDIYYVYIPFTSAALIPIYVRYTDLNTSTTERITDSGEDRVTDYPLTDPTLVLAYHRRWKKWTFLSINTGLYSLQSVNFRTPSIKGIVCTSSFNQAFVEYRTDQILPNDGNEEYDYANVLQGIEAQILTGSLGQQSPSNSCRIRKIEVDLMSGAITAQARRVQMQLYQARSGPRTVPATAITYSDKSGIVDSDGRNLHVARVARDTNKFWQLDLRISKCTTYTLLGIYVYVEKKEEINK